MNATLAKTVRPEIQLANRVITFAHEAYSQDLLDEMLPLLAAHYDEIALYQDIPLSPAKEIYRIADRDGLLRIYTARYEGTLVGYEVFFIYNHPHYSTALEAVQDVLFLAPDMRHGLIGYRFIKWCDEQLEQEKVQVIFRYVSNKHDYSSLLKRLGFVQHDVVYSRRIKSWVQ